MNWLRRWIVQWFARSDGLDGISLIDCKHIFISNCSDVEVLASDLQVTASYIRVDQAVVEARKEEEKDEVLAEAQGAGT